MAKCENCKEFEVINLWGKIPYERCEKKNDNPDELLKGNCPYFKPKTNADRIRNMTDEELANFLCKVKADYQWIGQEFPREDECGEWEEWLKSEVEE